MSEEEVEALVASLNEKMSNLYIASPLLNHVLPPPEFKISI